MDKNKRKIEEEGRDLKKGGREGDVELASRIAHIGKRKKAALYVPTHLRRLPENERNRGPGKSRHDRLLGTMENPEDDSKVQNRSPDAFHQKKEITGREKQKKKERGTQKRGKQVCNEAFRGGWKMGKSDSRGKKKRKISRG